jgi:hypothetical protein
MKRLMLTVLVLVLLCGATQAFAMEAPKVTTPTEGAVLGPNYDVLGSMPYKAFLVVMTDCMTADGTVLRSVPGIRHWTYANGTFHFRVASPRVSIGEKETIVSYRVRVFEMRNGQSGPETVVNCTMAQ